MKNKEKFDRICRDIKELKIQGASNIAIEAIKAYSLIPTENSIKKLISLRPTEPCLRNVLKFANSSGDNLGLAIEHLANSRDKIAETAAELVMNKSIVYTHCHSSTVISALIKARKAGKKFRVYCTETRPFMQGRITARDLAKEGIPVTMFVDSAMRLAIRKANLGFIGADAITSDLKIINKIGSELAAETASRFKLQFYVLTDSWKFDARTLFSFSEEIEQRSSEEVWKNAPKGIEISNYVFEKINSNLITAIISELGVLSPKKFVLEVLKMYPWMLRGGI